MRSFGSFLAKWFPSSPPRCPCGAKTCICEVNKILESAREAPLTILTKTQVGDPLEEAWPKQIRNASELLGVNVVGIDFTQHEHPLFESALRRMRSRIGVFGLKRFQRDGE